MIEVLHEADANGLQVITIFKFVLQQAAAAFTARRCAGNA